MKKPWISSMFLLLIALAFQQTPAFSQQSTRAHVQATTALGRNAYSRSANVKVPDAVVLDQNNHPLHFYRDLVQGKTVAINFIFTTCTTICPPLTANFASVQRQMLKRGKKNLQLISVSVDPENDTPAKLKSYAEMFNAQPGWTFVTGNRSQLEKIWNAFSISAGNKLDHSPTVVIGNDSRHQWTFASGLNSPEKLVRVINSVLANEGEEPAINAAK
jgi:protein SCO1/2